MTASSTPGEVLRPMSWILGDRGAITAEFAVVAPAVVLLVGACLATLAVSTEAIRLSDAAGIAARAIGRGDEGLAADAVAKLVPGAVLSVDRGDVVCVRLEHAVSWGPLREVVPLSAHGCAAAAGA
jgi:hypothetical protein